MDLSEFILREKARGDCYRFLSACFYLPQKEIFLEEGLLQNLTNGLKQINPDTAVLSNEMERAFLQYSDEELAVEYSKLFVGPYGLKAPPYGSVYLDKERRVMGDSTIEVIKIYEEAGLSISDDFKELPDHIAAELEFMYFLIFKEIEALERHELYTAMQFLEMQNKFLKKFLWRWIQPFTEKIKEGTKNKFYHGLSDCVTNFVNNGHLAEDLPESLTDLMREAK